ncbi:amino acid adenylation domain-containing protein [Streptomyces sp. SID8375]|nr:amino acid adenylation domain-containing protein [Streptomyces sp. SID8375]MYX11134.1 amino acid adenylation domain-containing protein [Streptomyces sp. SID8375]
MAADRVFWQRVLGGGFTPLPRWSRIPADLPAVRRTAIPAGTAEALLPLSERRGLSEGPGLSEGQGLSPDTLLLAAYVRVLAAVTGDSSVVTGYLPEDSPEKSPLPLWAALSQGSWAELVTEVAQLADEVGRHAPQALDELRAETGRTEPLFDTVLVAGRAPGPEDLTDGTVLAAGLSRTGDRLELVLSHRPDALDAEQADRFAGYLLAALRELAERPGADHQEWSPVPEREVAQQLAEFAGPRRELPDRRVHELFEDQVRLRPDDIAAVHGTEAWTYRELNERANRVAHALRRGGLRDEDVVAVVTERNLPWLVAVLAVFKAGGVYLPVEPHFPADRISGMLVRADCRRVLTERDASPGLTEALAGLPGVRADHLDTLLAEDHPVTDPGIPVAAGQSAYIYFTSGSTGAPKGAVCEHAGFLNHLLAKIDDLEITEGRVVAQTAPQCFDISLWQLVAALAVGGRTLIIGQPDILDTARFIETLDTGGVEVLQAVPSYLEVVLTELERSPRALPRLRHVSATGEALKKELVERWFATFPDVALVNAYGLTETSDDTNHEVMRRVPEQASVPLGKPVANVRIHVVDERLRLVPLGSPGEILFSGVCVGRGYVNDEERTRAAFMPDPLLPGERMYRSGDFGRWLPDGRLEFLGRRDAQVKIRGFRIEIGEVENQLLRVDGVRDSAVVVTGEGENRQLVAFHSGEELSDATLLEPLGAALPSYMIPSRFRRLDVLPLTANGKIDRKALTRLAGQEESAGDGVELRTGTERRLAKLWSQVLKVPAGRIGRASHFFDSGGTSLSMLRLAIALDRVVTPVELQQHPVLAECAALLDRRAAEAPNPGRQPVDSHV